MQEFERRIAEFLGVKHCVAVCNATIGLELAARAAGLRGEVIVPSYTFVATAHALEWLGITPVFADIDPETHCLDPASVEKAVSPRTTGIIGTHLWGRACDVENLTGVARRHNLALLFDAAHGFACSHKGKLIGGFGLAEVFSFHATKFMNSFEGGAITTNSDSMYAKLRLMKNFGFTGYDKVESLGTNGKMTEICAAMGLTNLECIGDLVSVNRRNYEAYKAGLAGIRGLRMAEYPANERSNYQYIVVEVQADEAGLTRDELVWVLHAEHVLARKYFWPGCHRMEPYRSANPGAAALLPETERVADRVLVLPTGQSIGEGEIELICRIISTALERAPILRAVATTLRRNESCRKA